MVLIGEMWEEHGHAVANCKPHLPGSFDVTPHNPVEKINSWYKAAEYITWVYSLCPALLYNILPERYWCNFCKFVTALHIMSQYSITPEDLTHAHELFVEWEHEFKMLYYQCWVNRIHFICPCVHLANHLAMEATCIGAPICSFQWTMEQTIGNLGQEIRQPSDQFSNLAQQGIQCCQVNTLKALFPHIDPPENLHPHGSEDIGNGFVLLRK
ncbi:hypothetical protein BS17DRAFT_765236 [Gyrodon lividus]|nr:hypothetical protein BS17DRAFT_765236 [Gyrodon lividus]